MSKSIERTNRRRPAPKPSKAANTGAVRISRNVRGASLLLPSSALLNAALGVKL